MTISTKANPGRTRRPYSRGRFAPFVLTTALALLSAIHFTLPGLGIAEGAE